MSPSCNSSGRLSQLSLLPETPRSNVLFARFAQEGGWRRIRRGSGFLENGVSAAAREAIFNGSELIEAVEAVGIGVQIRLYRAVGEYERGRRPTVQRSRLRAALPGGETCPRSSGDAA